MARPRIIKWGEGEIILRNCDPALTERIQKFLFPPVNEEGIADLSAIEPPPAPSPTPPKLKDMPMLAVGQYKNPKGNWETFVAKLNDSGQCSFVEKKVFSTIKDEAVIQFKIFADQYELT